MDREKEQWYSNKDLFEMMEALKDNMTGLMLEMKETKTLIRDYNGLRKNINDTNEKIGELKKEIGEIGKEVETHTGNRKEYIGYIIAAISILFLILNYFK